MVGVENTVMADDVPARFVAYDEKSTSSPLPTMNPLNATSSAIPPVGCDSTTLSVAFARTTATCRAGTTGEPGWAVGASTMYAIDPSPDIEIDA